MHSVIMRTAIKLDTPSYFDTYLRGVRWSPMSLELPMGTASKKDYYAISSHGP